MNTQSSSPLLGAITSMVAFVSGKLPSTKLVSDVTDSWLYIDPAIQDLVTFYFSNLAFLVSVVVGLITFRNFIHKKIRKHHAKSIPK